MALDPPTHFQFFLDVWNFFTLQHPLVMMKKTILSMATEIKQLIHEI